MRDSNFTLGSLFTIVVLAAIIILGNSSAVVGDKNTDKAVVTAPVQTVAIVPPQVAVDKPVVRHKRPVVVPNPSAKEIAKWVPAKFPAKVLASWYGSVYRGRRTSSGEKFNPDGFTAANRTLPFGTLVKVTYIKTGKTVVVKVTDRGPMNPKWEFDLSAGAADALGMKRDGVGQLVAEIMPGGQTCDTFGCIVPFPHQHQKVTAPEIPHPQIDVEPTVPMILLPESEEISSNLAGGQ